MKNGKDALPCGWETASIGDVTLAKVEQVDPQGPLTYIDIGSVDNQSKRITEPKSLAKGEKIPSRARQRLATDDVLVSMTRPNLNAVAIVPPGLDAAIGSTGFDVLRAIEVEPKWLFNIVKSQQFVESMSSIVQGALYPAVRPGDIRKYEIPVPPLAEQRRIVAKIEALQERSRKAREALAEVGPLLEQFRQSLLAAAFRGDLTADWRDANTNVEPATELLNRIRQERRQKWEQSELARYEAHGKKPPKGWQDKYKEPAPVDDLALPELPDGWCWSNLDSFIEFVTSGSRGWAEYYADEGPLFVRSQDINSDILILDDVAHVSPPPGSEGVRTRIQRGDLLVTITGANVAKAAFVDQELEEAYVSQHVALARLVDSHFVRYLHFWTISSANGRLQLLSHAYGNGKPGLNLDHLKTMTVAVPPVEEQTEILRILDRGIEYLSATIQNVADAKFALSEFDQSTLAKAFSGALVPQDPNDEPASVLLERIRESRMAKGSEKSLTKSTKKRPAMRQNVGEQLKTWIGKSDGKPFTFDDLRRDISGDYDELKDAVYVLLDEKSEMEQFFDESTGAMRFRRVGK